MSKDNASVDAELRSLEAALDAAIERARLAKQAVKTAKADAKHAKKARKRAKQALIEAQERAGLGEQRAPTNAESNDRSDDGDTRRVTGARIADSPERRRVPRKRRSAASPRRAKPIGAKEVGTKEPIAPAENATNEQDDAIATTVVTKSTEN